MEIDWHKHQVFLLQWRMELQSSSMFWLYHNHPLYSAPYRWSFLHQWTHDQTRCMEIDWHTHPVSLLQWTMEWPLSSMFWLYHNHQLCFSLYRWSFLHQWTHDQTRCMEVDWHIHPVFLLQWTAEWQSRFNVLIVSQPPVVLSLYRS